MDSRVFETGRSRSDAELLALLRNYLFLETDSEDQQLAFEAVCALVEAAPEDGWRLIEMAARMDLTHEQAAYFSAGPLEDFMTRYGEDMIHRLETEARRSADIRTLIAGVWRGGMSDAVWARVLALRQRLGIEPL